MKGKSDVPREALMRQYRPASDSKAALVSVVPQYNDDLSTVVHLPKGHRVFLCHVVDWDTSCLDECINLHTEVLISPACPGIVIGISICADLLDLSVFSVHVDLFCCTFAG